MEFYPIITHFISSAKSVQLKIPPFIQESFGKGGLLSHNFIKRIYGRNLNDNSPDNNRLNDTNSRLLGKQIP